MGEYRKKYDEDFKKNAVKLSYASPKSVKEIEKYSPDAVIGEIRVKGMKFDTQICTKQGHVKEVLDQLERKYKSRFRECLKPLRWTTAANF